MIALTDSFKHTYSWSIHTWVSLVPSHPNFFRLQEEKHVPFFFSSCKRKEAGTAGYEARDGWVRGKRLLGTRQETAGYEARDGWVRGKRWLGTRQETAGYEARD